MLLEIIKFFIYSALIVLISKFLLVKTLERMADILKLKATVIGNITGFATSIPELLTITIASLKGLSGASVYNILSSNIINLILYFFSIILNKNIKGLKNKAIIIDIVLVTLTIIIPVFLLKFDGLLNHSIIPIFIILYLFFLFINKSMHNLYLNVEKRYDLPYKKENNKDIKNKKTKIALYIFLLLITGILLFIVGELLGNNLNVLCRLFNVPQVLIGVLLGFTTSIPEMITFLEAQKHNNKNKDDNMLGIIEATNNLLSSNALNLFIIQTVGIILVSFRY